MFRPEFRGTKWNILSVILLDKAKKTTVFLLYKDFYEFTEAWQSIFRKKMAVLLKNSSTTM